MGKKSAKQKHLLSIGTKSRAAGGKGHLDMLRNQREKVESLEAEVEQLKTQREQLGNQVSTRNSRIVELMNSKNEMLNLNMWQCYEGINKIKQIPEYQGISKLLMVENAALQARLESTTSSQDLYVRYLAEQIAKLKSEASNLKRANTLAAAE